MMWYVYDYTLNDYEIISQSNICGVKCGSWPQNFMGMAQVNVRLSAVQNLKS